jgi:uncharacterized integral membrane protein
MDNKKVVKQVKNVVVNKSVISTAGLITILLVILKVTDNIDISWIWVFAPYWLPMAIVIGFMGIIIVGALLIGIGIAIYEALCDSKR